MTILFRNNDHQYIIETDDSNHFSYQDEYDGFNGVFIDDKRIVIDRKAIDHDTKMVFDDESYCEIKNSEGYLKFDIKVVEINKNNDNIDIVYMIDNELRQININYIRSKE